MTNFEKMCVSIDEAAKILDEDLIYSCPPNKEKARGCDERCTQCWREWLEMEYVEREE